jgi:adenylate cyclase
LQGTLGLPDGERKLAAIMFTDIIGYTALTQSNESQAMEVLERHNKLLRPFFPKFQRREVKAIGDSFLVEFESALEALRCAVEIQSYLHDYNLSSKDEWKIKLRIGIHLGDVIHKVNDVFGDAVNIASRIEPIAEPESICISEQVYDQVRNKSPHSLVRLAPRDLKNVQFPLELYKVVMPWEQAASPTEEVLNSPTRIAILPFANFSPDPNDDYFADGITDEIISAVAGISSLSVISRTSVRGYKATTKKIEEIGRELKVGSKLEGSFKKAGNRIRVTAQLIDVAGDKHLWAQNYDRQLDDVFEVQSDVAKQVADALRVRILSSEMERVEKKPTESTSAYTLYLKGRYHWNKRGIENVKQASQCFEEAVKEDPSFALGYVGQADCCLILRDRGLDLEENMAKAKKMVAQALGLDARLAEAHTTKASVLMDEYYLAEAEDEFKRAIELKPSYATAHQWYGNHLSWIRGRFEEAINELRRATELDPLSPTIRSNLAGAYAYASRLDEAIVQCNNVLDMEPNFPNALGWLMEAYLLKSMYREAIGEAEKLVRSMPEEPLIKYFIGFVYGLAGMQGQAKKILGEMVELSKIQYVRPAWFIQLYFSIGEMDKMYGWMQKDYDEHGVMVPIMRWEPLYRRLWADPRFKDFMKKVGLE